MEIIALAERSNIEQNKKLYNAYNQFNKLITELRKKELTEELIMSINMGIEQLNNVPDSEKELKKRLRKTQSFILNIIEKKLKLVTINHYRNSWLAIGMAAIGIPIGVAFGSGLGNMAFIGVGLPIGLSIGIAIGTGMDKKAFEEGRQLDLEIKY